MLKDDAAVLDFFATAWNRNNFVQVTEDVLSNTDFWGTDLTEIDGLQEEVTTHLEAILDVGMKTALETFINN